MFCFFFTFEQEHWHRVLSKIDHKVSKSVKFVFILINTTVIDIHSFLWLILIMKGCVKPWIVFRILAKLFRKPCCYLCPFIFLQWTNMLIFQCPSFYEAYIHFSWFSLTSIYINIAYGYKLKSKKVKKKSLHIGCQQVGSMLVQRLSLTSIYINISYWYKLKSKKVKKK